MIRDLSFTLASKDIAPVYHARAYGGPDPVERGPFLFINIRKASFRAPGVPVVSRCAFCDAIRHRLRVRTMEARAARPARPP